ncbi:MAG: chemotaxis protein CheW [Anaerolineales bacterium]
MNQKKKKIEDALGNLFSSSKKNPSKKQANKSAEDAQPQVLKEEENLVNSAVVDEQLSHPQASATLSTENQTADVPAKVDLPSVESSSQPPQAAKPENGNKKNAPSEIKAQRSTETPPGNANDSAPVDLLQQPVTQPSGNGKGAISPQTAFGNEEVRQLVVFNLAEEAFGLPIDRVESIIKTQAITVVPHARPYVVGVTNLRGTVLPVIDLRRRFDMPSGKEDEQQRIVVVNFRDEKIGLLVDSVSQVLSVPVTSIEPPPPLVSAFIHTAFITGIAKIEERLVILLDLDKILVE